ncbi:glutamate receptor ionotropic, kainate 5-like [Sinocyclocheilus grahami]|uniref:glutamate receptor ionotropic, kainate 5-like n=1 Tax=Sinocyclocheilus grahami TaxID=75366 RepID=UPI0007ACD478|nr:PREDICTED: glutamate receptor ionotropic, kainate 5-like [Sinocyclocheilus grahami]
MPALPALLLSIHLLVLLLLLLLLTMAPSSHSQVPALSAVRMAAILDDQSACGRGERLALALARENINSVMEGPSRARVEVDIFELQRDSQYETTDTSLLRLEELVRHFLISRETLSVRMLDENLDPTPLLKEIRDDKVATIIIDANASVSILILKKASELGMMSAFYKYILTTMDFPLLRLDDVVDDQSNIIGFSMLNSSHPFYLEFIRSLNLSWREGCDLSPYPGPALSSALMFDAVHVVVGAVRELNRSQEIGVKPLSCTSSLIWQHGTSLMNYLRMIEYDGLTGRVEFNSKGQRTNYTLRILEKFKGGHKEIGVWYSNNTLAMNSTSLDINASETLANKTLIVTTILEDPYVKRKAHYQDFRGNDQYEGFCVDMLRELADILKFSFRIKLVDDRLYGAPEPNGSWTGMVGELINRKADLAVAGFTITSEREKVIDFSKPFMNLGISILYRVHIGRKPGYFSFLDPFSPAVWLFMLLAYLAVSCVLFLAARLSPYEWYNPFPCWRDRSDLLENQYTLGNSLWFPIGGFMQQGSEIMPRALSTRCVSGVWWAFTLIIISSYTANLAAFLTVQRMEVPIESADDLADQTNIQYGTIQGGSTMTFFMNSRYQTYQRMWNYMYSKQPSVFVKSTEEGIARVLNSKYAFLLESTMNEYHRRLNCNLTQIGGLLDTKGYGIGMPLGSPFRDEITLGILQLQENNRLEVLKRRWWEGGKCPKEEDHRAKGLAIMEFVWSTRRSAETDEVRLHSCPIRNHRHSRVSVCQEMMTEFRNVISCKKNTRLRRRRPLSSQGILRPPARLPLGAPRQMRLVREMRLSNGKLYSGTGPLTGAAAGPGPGGGAAEMGPGPQRLLEDPLSASVPSSAPALVPTAAPRGCTHVRVCQECRRIQSLRSMPSCSRISPLASATSSLPRLPPPPPSASNTNTDSEEGGSGSPRRAKPTPPPRPLPPTKTPSTDLLCKQD